MSSEKACAAMVESQDFGRFYRETYPTNPMMVSYRWHPLNPISVAYRQELERALVEAIGRAALSPREMEMLDVGCGGGGRLRFFAELGAQPAKLHGIDLIEERVIAAQQANPAIDVQVADATDHLPFEDDSFDLVSQFVVFSSIIDTDRQRAAAREMVRVLRPGGWLLWYDTMVPNAGQIPEGVSEAKVESLLPDVDFAIRRRLHHRGLARLARWPTLSAMVGSLPWIPRTNVLMLGRKASI